MCVSLLFVCVCAVYSCVFSALFAPGLIKSKRKLFNVVISLPSNWLPKKTKDKDKGKNSCLFDFISFYFIYSFGWNRVAIFSLLWMFCFNWMCVCVNTHHNWMFSAFHFLLKFPFAHTLQREEKKFNIQKNVPHSNSNLQSKSDKKMVTTSNLHKIRNIISRVGVSFHFSVCWIVCTTLRIVCIVSSFFIYFFLCGFAVLFRLLLVSAAIISVSVRQIISQSKLFQNFHSSHFFFSLPLKWKLNQKN